MKKILFICKEQFGYHIDSYKYCCLLGEDYDITYLCFDKGQEHIDCKRQNVSVIYVSWKGKKLFRSLRFIVKALREIYSNKSIVFVIYLPGFFIFKLLAPFKKMILDIRTLSVSPNPRKRKIEDYILYLSTFIFSYVTVISNGVANKLLLSNDKSSLLPLGADSIAFSLKSFERIKLLYVGTLTGRNIIDTLKGLLIFNQKYPDLYITYDIVGEGDDKVLLKDFIETHNLNDRVLMHGYLSHDRLTKLFSECNVGVAYVPITPYYEEQPSTKVFEYAMSGLYTIATDTNANRAVINKENGILIKDNSSSFALAIERVYLYGNKFNSGKIRDSLSKYEWKNIVDTYLVPVINRFI